MLKNFSIFALEASSTRNLQLCIIRIRSANIKKTKTKITRSLVILHNIGLNTITYSMIIN